MASPNEHTINEDTTPGSVGVARALEASASSEPVAPTLFTREFSLTGRVALVTGANRGIGLEAALALAEAGARSVYCLDLFEKPSENWTKVHDLVARMGLGSLEYMCVDVRDQGALRKAGETIGDKEGRLDVCVIAAGVHTGSKSFLEYTDERFQGVMDVNLKGALFTAQAAASQMVRFGNGGSISFLASVTGSVALEPTICTIAYQSAKSAILQMARCMACELGSKRIRVNTISPGWIGGTAMTQFLDIIPELREHYERANPLGRIGRPEELRGVVVWLASDASSFCTGSDIIVSGGHHAW